MTKCILISVCKVCTAVLNDLSKSYGCLLHNLLIAKLHTIGFDLKSLRVIHAYPNLRIQVTKVGSCYSEVLQIIYGVPKSSILGQLLFNVILISLLLADDYISNFSNCADDTTSCNCWSTVLETLSDLEITLDNLFNSFCYKNFKANASKCHLFLPTFNAKPITVKSSVIEGSCGEKFYGITIDSNF